MHAHTHIFTGDRLQNFEIRVGNDGDDIGNNAVCFKQLEPMEPGVAKNFTCSSGFLGSWVSVNKSSNNRETNALHFREIRVYGGKYISISCNYLGLFHNPISRHDFRYR